MSWPLVKLAEVAQVNPRLPKDVDETQQVIFLPMVAISEQGQILEQEKRILSETRKGFTYFEKNDVVVAKITPCFENGKAAFLDDLETQIGFGTSEFHVIRPDIEKLDGKYLFYLVWNKWFRHLGERNMSGSAGQKRVPTDFLKGLEIPLPPLDEQKRIAAILDKADAIRRKRQQAINLADDFLRSVFLDMFGDPVSNPKGWEVKQFGDVIDVLTDYHANGSYKTLVKNVTLMDEPSYAYMVRTTDLEKKNHTDSVKYIDKHAYEHLSKSKVFGGEIIMNKIGSAGAVYLMPYLNKPVSLAMNQFMIRCNELSINEFMYYQLKTETGAREISKRVQGAVTKTITKDAVRGVSIILPPLELQQKFIEIVTQIKELTSKIHCSFDLTKSEFNSLSQKAFAGEL